MGRLMKVLKCVVLEALFAAGWTAAQQIAPLFESGFAASHSTYCRTPDKYFRACAGKTHMCHSSINPGSLDNDCLIQCGVCGMNRDMGMPAESVNPAIHSSPLYVNDGVYLNRETDKCLLPTSVNSEKAPGSCFLQARQPAGSDRNVLCFDLRTRRQVSTMVTVTYNDLSTYTFQRGLAHETLWYVPVDEKCSKVMVAEYTEQVSIYCSKATTKFRTWNFFHCLHKVYAKSIKILATPDPNQLQPQNCQMFICEVSAGFGYWTCALGWYPDVSQGSGSGAVAYCKPCKERCQGHDCIESGNYCPQCPSSAGLKYRGKSCMLPCPRGCLDQTRCDRWAAVCYDCVPFRYGPLCDKACDRCLTKCNRVDGTCTGGECIPGRWDLAANCEKVSEEIFRQCRTLSELCMRGGDDQ